MKFTVVTQVVNVIVQLISSSPDGPAQQRMIDQIEGNQFLAPLFFVPMIDDQSAALARN